jgi:hypothetical protein
MHERRVRAWQGVCLSGTLIVQDDGEAWTTRLREQEEAKPRVSFGPGYPFLQGTRLVQSVWPMRNSCHFSAGNHLMNSTPRTEENRAHRVLDWRCRM